MAELISESLRNAMRHWATGVSIVTSEFDGERHGMTVNSFTSISLDPPRVSVALATLTRTHAMVMKANCFGVTILGVEQADLSDRFAGKVHDLSDRFEGIDTTTLITGSPFIVGGIAYVDCRVGHVYPLENTSVFIGDVVAAWYSENNNPLIYHNRSYHKLE